MVRTPLGSVRCAATSRGTWLAVAADGVYAARMCAMCRHLAGPPPPRGAAATRRPATPIGRRRRWLLGGSAAQRLRQPVGGREHRRGVHPARLAGEALERTGDGDRGDDLPAGGA